jgi:hypothetical protein
MIREDGGWTYFTCGAAIDPDGKDERGVSLKAQMQGGHFKPQGIYKSIKYDPLNVRPSAFDAINGCTAIKERTLSRSKSVSASAFCRCLIGGQNYFDYTIPLLEKMTAVAKLGAK